MYLQRIDRAELYASVILAYSSYQLELKKHGDYLDNQVKQSSFYFLIKTLCSAADIHTNILIE